MGGAERKSLLHRLCNFIRRSYICNNASVASIDRNNSKKDFILKIDSGASHNFIATRHQQQLQNLRRLVNGPIATLPNNQTVTPSHQGNIPLHKDLTPAATSALVYPNIRNESLLSVGQLCDDGCIAIFVYK